MKYLKTFESDNFNIKKYIVWKFPSNFIVLKVIRVTYTDIICIRLYNM
jgi:hypothetical protein